MIIWLIIYGGENIPNLRSQKFHLEKRLRTRTSRTCESSTPAEFKESGTSLTSPLISGLSSGLRGLRISKANVSQREYFADKRRSISGEASPPARKELLENNPRWRRTEDAQTRLNSCLKLSFLEGDRGVHHPGGSPLKPPPDGPGKVIKACDSGENNQSLVSNHVFSGSQRTRRTSVWRNR